MSTTGKDHFSPNRLRSGERLLAAGLAIALLAPWGIAAWLEPDGRGYGTHEQMGFPPCGVQAAWGLPCPTCGMTTAWAYAVRGRLARALHASVAGTLLATLDLAAVPWLLAAAIAGRWRGMTPHGRPALVLAVAVALVTLIEWGIRLAVLTT